MSAARTLAAVAVAAVVAGATGLLVAVSAVTVRGYVSEAGVPGARFADLYRWSVVLVGLACGLLALALRRVPFADPPTGRLAGRVRPSWAPLALAAAAPFGLVSGVVTCSPGCPLPPYETPSAQDLVHAGAAIVSLLLSAVAMPVLALRGHDRPLRTVGWAGLAVAVPLLAAAGLSLVVAGRGLTTGVLERLALVAALGWLVATALVVATRAADTALMAGAGAAWRRSGR